MTQNILYLMLSSEKSYLMNIAKTIVALQDSFDKLYYLSLVRPHMEVISDLKEENIDTSNMIFIDTTRTNGDALQQIENCLFTSKKVGELQKNITELLNEKKGCLIIDTISALLMHEKNSDILKFAHSMLNEPSLKEIQHISIAVKDLNIKQDENNHLISDLKMFAKKSIELD